jgi:CheY-like chemotaxis protein
MICDVMRPKTNGLELTRLLRTRLKNLRVILLGGQVEHSAWRPADLGQIHLLENPLLNEDLVTAVTEALASHPSLD